MPISSQEAAMAMLDEDKETEVSTLHELNGEEVTNAKHDDFLEETFVFVQKEDLDEAIQLQVGKVIFQLFLLNKCRLEKIILCTKRLEINSTHANTADLEVRTKHKRMTRRTLSESV